jgi:hypothetical protein
MIIKKSGNKKPILPKTSGRSAAAALLDGKQRTEQMQAEAASS